MIVIIISMLYCYVYIYIYIYIVYYSILYSITAQAWGLPPEKVPKKILDALASHRKMNADRLEVSTYAARFCWLPQRRSGDVDPDTGS